MSEVTEDTHAEWETPVLAVGITVLMIGSWLTYYFTSESYRINKAKRYLGYKVYDISNCWKFLAHCCFGPVYRKQWEANHVHYRSADYGPEHKNWSHDQDNDKKAEWSSFAYRGDNKQTTTAAAKAVQSLQNALFEEFWNEFIAIIAGEEREGKNAERLLKLDKKRKGREAKSLEELQAADEKLAKEEESRDALELEEDLLIQEEDSKELLVGLNKLNATVDVAKSKASGPVALAAAIAKSSAAAALSVSASALNLGSSVAAAAGGTAVLVGGAALAARKSRVAQIRARASKDFQFSNADTPLPRTSLQPATAIQGPPVDVLEKLDGLENRVLTTVLKRMAQEKPPLLVQEEFARIVACIGSHRPGPMLLANMFDKVLSKIRNTEFMPYVSTLVPLSAAGAVKGNGAFINACYHSEIDGTEHRYISTTLPLTGEENNKVGTQIDFWRMILEQNAACIVSLEPVKSSDKYWPNVNFRMSFGSLIISCTQEETIASSMFYTKATLEIVCEGESPVRLHHFQYTPPAPDAPMPLIALVHAVTSTVRSAQRPIVVHCNNAVGATGIFLAVSHGIHMMSEQTELEKSVDILQIVSHLRCERPSMVRDDNEYHQIYAALCMSSYAESYQPPPPKYVEVPAFSSIKRNTSRGPRGVSYILADDASSLDGQPNPDDSSSEDDGSTDYSSTDEDDAAPAPFATAMIKKKVNVKTKQSMDYANLDAPAPAPVKKSAMKQPTPVAAPSPMAAEPLKFLSVCSSCDIDTATIHCLECDDDFCGPCDVTKVHSGAKARLHHRKPIPGVAEALQMTRPGNNANINLHTGGLMQVTKL